MDLKSCENIYAVGVSDTSEIHSTARFDTPKNYNTRPGVICRGLHSLKVWSRVVVPLSIHRGGGEYVDTETLIIRFYFAKVPWRAIARFLTFSSSPQTALGGLAVKAGSLGVS